MKLLKIFNEENVSEEIVRSYKVRNASRAIVFDDVGNIALLHMTKDNYYELPGGGVEPEESLEQGCIRECKEEIGCDVEITGEVGKTLEYRMQLERVNASHCFTARVIGEKGAPTLAEDEVEMGTETIWVAKDKAIELIKTGVPKSLYDKYIIERSIVFLNQL